MYKGRTNTARGARLATDGSAPIDLYVNKLRPSLLNLPVVRILRQLRPVTHRATIDINTLFTATYKQSRFIQRVPQCDPDEQSFSRFGEWPLAGASRSAATRAYEH